VPCPLSAIGASPAADTNRAQPPAQKGDTMFAYASFASGTGDYPASAGMPDTSEGRLIRRVVPGKQRKQNRRILMYLPGHESYQKEFGRQLEQILSSP
jgi:hypothetical protein